MFNNILDGIEFYRGYAARCRFDIRNSTVIRSKDGTITWKYILCNRAGEKNAAVDRDATVDGVMDKRRRVSRRVRCRARIVLKFSGLDGYSIHSFEERHSHPLVCDKHKGFLKVNRNMGHVHQKFILDCVRANIGAIDSYKLYNEVAGGHCNIGCTKNDVKNFTRDLRAYIVGADAQMVIDNLFKRREVCSAFYFEYLVDGEDKLKHIFWADPICRRNFAAFGDSVSFDATYNTNRYKMVFTPFTGKDNHGKCVTFGAALLSSENTESYGWVLEKFKDCMGRPPSILITDQDLALKNAVKHIFPDIRHQLCMWHIMLKFSDKLPPHLKKDKSLRQQVNRIVWSDVIKPAVFEEKWQEIMSEFGLTDMDWFKSMYDLRYNWILAYFRNHPLSGLCRTTSISESANNFYGSFVNSNCNLVEFFMKYNNAIEAQVHAYAEMNSYDESTVPSLQTPILFEKHAAAVYTTNIFVKVQKKIYSACFKYRIMSITKNEPQLFYDVNDGDEIFQVVYDSVEETVVCSCSKFVQEGLMCCHIYILLKDLNIDRIPDKYVVRRWTRSCFDSVNGCLTDLVSSCAAVDENKMKINTCISEFYAYIGVADGDDEKLSALLRCVRDFKEFLKHETSEEGIKSDKNRIFYNFYGSSRPTQVDVLPPDVVKTKGSGSRLIPRVRRTLGKRKNL
ncbi:hypothetical protein C2S53_017814 [Perilla frutescens var. hirtella]|uniref:SWIM-type domain-containing protein n=1 Tax=Perilla frutescens var. hirtella TaxID=608512 RepID=A0AAD4P4F2_PERFH|nr:hypothetical protein C2S53_017814 [Perilla frutescens var. hirtella]